MEVDNNASNINPVNDTKINNYEKKEINQKQEFLLKKYWIINELNDNKNNLVMIVQKSIENFSDKDIKEFENKCKQKYDSDLQCTNECFEPIPLKKLNSYILILGTQKEKPEYNSKSDELLIPLKNSFIYRNDKINYFGENIILSKEDILLCSTKDFEHDLIKSINKGTPITKHIKIINQSKLAHYLNFREEEKKIYDKIKEEYVKYQVNSFKN